MIKVQNLKKTYNKGKANECIALSKVNLDIGEGEMVAIIGKSGAGKSTLLHILGGIDNFDEGSAFVKGIDLSKLKGKERANYRNKVVGIVMQDYGLIEDYTVYENICIPLEINNNKESAKWKKDNVLNQIGIDELSNKNVMQLSGGQRQRVAIARAIVNSPSVILADEPTGALDTNTSEDIINIFKNINKQGVTVVIVTHEPTVAEQCGRIISICDGTIAAIKTNSNLQ